MNRNLDRAKFSDDSSLFCQLSKTKFGYKPCAGHFRHWYTHSLRISGATAAANAGIPDRFFNRHGRWSSDSAKDGYVKDSLSSRLSVS